LFHVKQLTKSPISNAPLKPYLECMDHTVSRELFTILIDKETELLITSPRPVDGNFGKYYESNDYISHSNSNKSLFDKIYQIVRNYTIKRKIKLINSVTKNEKKILDIGAGTGDFLMACKKDGWTIEGIEPNTKARSIAKQKLDIEFKADSSELNSGEYDVITMWHVLEHVPELNEQIALLKKLLKPSGTLIVAVPNFNSHDAAYYKEFWAAYDVPRHLWHFSQKAIRLLFQKEKMEVINTLPMMFDAFYVSLLSEKYKNQKMNLLKGFYRGFLSNLKARRTKEYSSLIYLIKNA